MKANCSDVTAFTTVTTSNDPYSSVLPPTSDSKQSNDTFRQLHICLCKQCHRRIRDDNGLGVRWPIDWNRRQLLHPARQESHHRDQPNRIVERWFLDWYPLFTAVSNALVTACGSPTSGTRITSCTPATITSVSYMEGVNVEEGDLKLAVPLISVSGPNTMQALIVAVAGAFQANSLITNNTQSIQAWPDTVCSGETNPCTHGPYNLEMTTINSIAQAIYTSDIASEHPHVQNLQAILAFEKGSAGKAACSKEALVMDSLAAVGAFLAIIEIIPGFEWTEAAADALEVVCAGLDTANAALAGGAEAVSITCEVREANGGE